MTTLYEDMHAVEKLINAATNRAADLEQLTRLTAHLTATTAKRALRNAQILERIAERLGVDISDIEHPYEHLPEDSHLSTSSPRAD